MSYNNGKITAPVNMNDIVEAIGADTDVCRSPNINIWAKYRPYMDYNNIIREATDSDRRASSWGLFLSSEVDADDSTFVRIIYQMQLPGNNDFCRMLDFNGYNHFAECGFALTPATVTYPNTYATVKMVGSTGDNITWTELAELIADNEVLDNLTTFGLQLRSTRGSIPLLTIPVGSASQLKSKLSSYTSVALEAMADCPSGVNAELHIYGLDNISGQKKSICEPTIIQDTRSVVGGAAAYYHFAPNMQIGTFISGLKKANEWWDGNTITIGSNDFFRMGFYIRNESSSTMIFQPRLKVKTGGKVYYLRVYYLSSNATISIPAWGAAGSTSYSASPSFYCSYADFAQILPNGVQQEATIQLCNINEATGAETAILTPPMTFILLYNGNNASGRPNYPSFPPISTPDWSGGFDI